MTIEKLRSLHQARPFHPFRIHLADDRNLPVVHPEFLSMAPNERTIVVHLPDSTMQIIDLLLVVSLEPMNGQRRARGRRRT